MIGKKINQLATELAPVSTDLTIIGDPISGVSKKITLAQLGAIFSGAVSFYTNLAGFPATGDINVIYCAKDTQKLYLWSGSAYVEVFPSQALLDTYQLRSEKGVSNGYASLDSSGKVPISQLPSSIMEYKGTWNAATNTPTLANGTGDTGDVYICNVAGTVNFGAGAITFAVGDYVIYSGSIWQRSSGAVGTVTSVAVSRSGDALAITGSPITTSGTINIGFAGTGAQYIKGDGTLATFPNTISQAEKLITEVYNSTGATLTKGTIVYINGGQGNLPTVTKALATGDSTSAQTFGVVQADITNMNNGYVVVAGKLSDLDTQAYTPGTQLYLSSTTAGTWTSTKQYAPNHLVYIGIVVRAHPTQGIVEIKIQNGYELDELHNVAAQTPTNNDGLFWESATSLWKNKSIATVLGYTPQPQLSGTGFVKISGTTISYDNSTYLTTSAAASTYLPLILNGSANTVDINGQQFTIQGSAGGFTSGRIIVDPVFSAIGYQNAGVFDGLKILTNGNAEFTNSGVTRFFNQVRFDSTLTNGTYTYTLPGATGTIALVGGAGVGTVTSVGLSSATSGVTIGSTPITTSGTITLAIATASGSQQGLLSSTDWTTFNNKQNALTNPVTGTGTTNYLPKFTGTSTIGNSLVQDNGSTVSIITGSTVLSLDRTGGATALIELKTGGTVRSYLGADTSMPFVFFNQAASPLMYLNASGNLGLGVTPSAWWSGMTAMQIGTGGGVYSANATNDIYLINNAFFDGTNFRYVNSDFAGISGWNGGQFQWVTAPSGTAGNAISFTQAMTLNASGNLSIGNTNDSYKLDVSGIGRFTGQLTVSTNNGIIVGANARAFIRQSVGGDAEIGAASGGLLYLLNNGSTALQFGATGAATFSSSVTATQFVANGASTVPNLILNGPSTTWTRYQTSGTDRWDIGNNVGGLSSNQFSFYSNGASSNVFVIQQNGNVGIGSTSPSQKLHVEGAGTTYALIKGGGNNTTGLLTQNGNKQYFTGTYYNVSDAWEVADLTAGGLTRLMITSGGNVGIGTTSPFGKLSVDVTAAAPSPSGNMANGLTVHNTSFGRAIQLGVNESGAYTYIQSSYVNNADVGVNLAFFTGANERMRISSGGNLLVGTTTDNATKVQVNGAIWTNSGLYLEATDAFIWQLSNSSLRFATNSTERMRITSGGAVSINTTQSLAQLNVKSSSSGSTARALALYNNIGDSVNTGVSIEFYPNGGDNDRCARISSVQATSGNYADLRFFTSNNVAPAEAMRITSGGNTIINPVGGNGVYSQSLLTIKASVADGNQIHMVQFNDDRGWRMKAQDNGHFYLQSTYQNSNSTVITANYDTGLVQFATGIKTGAPTNGTAETWRLGNAVSGSISTNSYIIVSVNGTTYSIPALNGLP